MEYQKLKFKAVTIHRKGEDIDYTSVPIQEAEELYTTVGLYEMVEKEGSCVEKHIVDMSIEDFGAVLNSRFPNGFDEWQETHFEIVDYLSSIGLLKNNDQPKFLREMQSRFGRSFFHVIARDWTDEFEKKNKGRSWDGELFEEVRKFTKQKIEEIERLS